MTKRQLSAWLVAGFLVCLLIAVVRHRKPSVSEESSPQQATEAPRPSPINRDLPRLPLKIVDDKDSVRTRKVEPGVVKAASPPVANSSIGEGGTDWAVVAAIYQGI